MSGVRRYGRGSASPDGSTGSNGTTATENVLADKTQGGRVTTNGSGVATVVFDVAFAALPVVLPGSNSATPGINAQANNITTTGFTMATYVGATAVAAATSWIAFGKA